MQTHDPISIEPASAREFSDGEFTIVVQINVPALLAAGAPQAAIFAGQCGIVLNEVLTLALRLEGIESQGIGFGPQYDCICHIKVHDLHPALKNIQATLARVLLIEAASIHWWDGREDFMRPVRIGCWCNQEEQFSFEKVLAKLEQFKQANQQSTALLQAAMAAILARKTPQQLPPESGQ